MNVAQPNSATHSLSCTLDKPDNNIFISFVIVLIIYYENLVEKFNAMIEKNQEIVETLKKRIPEIQKKSNLSGVYLQQALAEKGLL